MIKRYFFQRQESSFFQSSLHGTARSVRQVSSFCSSRIFFRAFSEGQVERVRSAVRRNHDLGQRRPRADPVSHQQAAGEQPGPSLERV